MKRYTFAWQGVVVAAAALLSASCSEQIIDNDAQWHASNKPVALSVTPRQAEISDKAQSKAINVKAENVEWYVNNVPGWLTVSPQKGGGSAQVNVQAQNNTGENERVAIMTVQTTNLPTPYGSDFTLKQASAAPYITFTSLGSNVVEVPAAQTAHTVNVGTNRALRASVREQDKSWLDASYKDKVLTIHVQANANASAREGSVTLTTEKTVDGKAEMYKSVVVRQNGAISVSPTELTFNVDGLGNDRVLEVSAGEGWSLTAPDWITLSARSGSGSAKVVVRAKANGTGNDRTGSIEVFNKANVKLADVKVSQGYVSLTAAQEKLSFRAGGSSAKLNVQANCNWMLTNKPSWISMSTDKGAGNAEVTLTAAPIKTRTPLKATLALKVRDDAQDQTYETVTLEQEGISVSASEAVSLPAAGGTETIEVRANANWTLSIPAEFSWIKLSSKSGSVDETVKVTVDPYGGGERKGYVVLSDAIGEVQKVYVNQSAATYDVSKSKIALGVNGGSESFSIKTTSKWSLKIPEEGKEWITLSEKPAWGSDNVTDVTVTASRNEKTVKRVARISLCNADGNPVQSIQVEQEPVVLDLDPPTMDVRATSSTNKLNIRANSYWVLTCTSWIDLETKAGFKDMSLNVTVRENSNTKDRVGYIYLKSTGGDRVAKVTVTQKGKGASAKVNVMTYADEDEAGLQTPEAKSEEAEMPLHAFAWEGGELDLYLGGATSTPSAASVKVLEGDWLCVEKATEGAEADMVLKALENPTLEERTAILEVVLGGQTYTYTVKQKGKDVVLSAGMVNK